MLKAHPTTSDHFFQSWSSLELAPAQDASHKGNMRKQVLAKQYNILYTMDKAKTSVRRRTSMTNTRHKNPHRKIKPGMGVEVYDPTQALLDEERIGRAIWECLKNGDPEGVIEVVQIHLNALNKTQCAKTAHLPKTTLYHSLRSKNPTIRTLAKLIHAFI